VCAAAAAAALPEATAVPHDTNDAPASPCKKTSQKKIKQQALRLRLQEADAETDEQVERKRVMDRHARAVEAEIGGCEARVRLLF